MRFLKRLLGIAIGFVILSTLVAFLLPREVQVSRSITIYARPDKVFPLVNSLQDWQKWSPWIALDPETKLAFSGPTSGVGNRFDWRSDHEKVGAGTQIILTSTPHKHVETRLEHSERRPARAVFELEPTAIGTTITWRYQTDTGLNPVARWKGLTMDRQIGGDYERGLTNLKSLAESL